MNVLKEMTLSVYSYESYGEFLKNRKGKVFGFGVLLMFLYFLIVLALPMMINLGTPNALAERIRETVPDFAIEDGRLWAENVAELDLDTVYVYINTNPDYSIEDIEELRQSLTGYTSAIIADSEKMLVKSNGQEQIAYWSQMGLEGFDREDLMGIIPMLYVVIAIVLVLCFLGMTALFFFGVLFVALLGMIAVGKDSRFTFGQLYQLGVYSRTLPLIIKAVVSFLPFHVPFFWVINFGLSLFILYMAVRKMPGQTMNQM